MQKYKTFLLVLLFLLAVSLVSVRPGAGGFEIFYLSINKLFQNFKPDYLLNLLVLYPPFIFVPQFLIIHFFPPDRAAYLLTATSFFTQTSFILFKVFIYLGFISTWFSILYFAKSVGRNIKKDWSNISLVFFSSVSIMLSSLALGNTDIMAGAFLVMSVVFMFKRRWFLTNLFYLMSILTNWSLIIFAPIYYLTLKNNTRKQSLNRVFYMAGCYLIPLLFVLKVIHLLKLDQLDISIFSKVFSPTWVFTQIGKMLFATNIGIIGLVASFAPLLLCAFIFLYVRLILKDNFVNTDNKCGVIVKLTTLYYLYLLLFPWSSVGNLIYPVILSLLLYVIKKSEITKIQLVITNLMAFTNIFLIFGINGIVPIRGFYIELATCLMAVAFSIYWLVFIINSEKIGRYVENN